MDLSLKLSLGVEIMRFGGLFTCLILVFGCSGGVDGGASIDTVTEVLDSEEVWDNSGTADVGSLLPFEACVFHEAQGSDSYLDVAYATEHEAQRIDIRVPKGKDEPYPVLIWIHGGAWKQGTKSQVPTWLKQVAAGDFAIASIDYRFSDNPWPATAADVRTAIRWLRAHASEYNLNPNQFGVLGSSAGGHLSSLVAVGSGVEALNGEEALGNWDVSDAVQAAAPFYGPHDFASLDLDRDLSLCEDDKEMVHGTSDSPETLLLDCTPTYMDCLELAKEASPLTYVDASDPPTFVVHGLDDCTIAPNQSVRMADALDKAGVPTYLALVPGAGHNSSQCVEFGELVIPLRGFFDRYVRGCDTEKFFEAFVFNAEAR